MDSVRPDVSNVFCDDCGRVLNRATGRCVCEDDARLRRRVLVGATAGGTWTTGPSVDASWNAFEVPAAPADARPEAPPVVRGAGVPRLVDEDGDVLDLVVYEDALVLSRFGLVGEVDAAPVKGISSVLRRGRVKAQNAKRMAMLEALPAEQALMTESRNRLVPVRPTDTAEVRPTRDGGTVTLRLHRATPRTFVFATACAPIDEVQEALGRAFGDRVTRRRPRLSTVLGVAFDLALTVCLVGLAAYVVWSTFGS